ncbi:ECF transporter S component [Haliovirga abyssi]|uniref:Membrane protein n=1 Tax=Haliovirga abyssi TaxID=2996794 RepID=A0AAU9DZE7_9FUSO|nr:ECF transporter S component [Haliovirga abyssi]BDU50915.1 membrane protein [Haliovirga abyssi]
MEISVKKIKEKSVSFLLAFGITLIIPWVVHYIGLGLNLKDPSFLGKTFLPMHIGVFLAAMIYGPFEGVLVGALAPIVSFMVTGMPIAAPFPMAQIMTIELTAYGFITGAIYNKTKNEYISLISGMLLGRVVVFIALSMNFIMIKNPKFLPTSFIVGGIMAGLVGIVIQLAIIPMIVKKLKK